MSSLIWRLVIPCEPMRRPDPAPNGRGGLRNHKDYQEWLDKWTPFVHAHRPRPAFDAHVLMDVRVYRTPPTKLPKGSVAGGRVMTKPDGDRYHHAAQDLCERGGVFANDGQVSDWSGGKRYATKGSPPRLEITVTALEAA